jgi:N-succinyldiaminopimelate aminotransferase
MTPLAQRLQGIPPTIFTTMSALALRTGAVNLGQGFPDADGPASVLEAARDAIASGANQYAPGNGVAVLRHAIARHQQRHYGLDLDPDTQVLVTTGCTEGIAAAMLGLVDPGDEVVVLEPYYDSYVAMIQMAGARSPCALPTSGWTSTSSGPPSDRARGSCCSTHRTTRPAPC